MTNTFIAVSGCGGGDRGPQGLYKILQETSKSNSFNVLPIETVPEKIQENVDRISKISKEHLQKNENVYLMGYSMGAAIAVITAHQLNQDGKHPIQGIVLLASQTDGLHLIKTLDIPILFFHGNQDQYFSIGEIGRFYKKYGREKRMVQFDGVGHTFEPSNAPSAPYCDREGFARRVELEVSDFFFPSQNSVRILNERDQTQIPRADTTS